MTTLGNYTIGAEVDQAQLKKFQEKILKEITETGEVSKRTLSKYIASGFEWGFAEAKKQAQQTIEDLKKRLLELKEARNFFASKWDKTMVADIKVDLEQVNKELKEAEKHLKSVEKQEIAANKEMQKMGKEAEKSQNSIQKMLQTIVSSAVFVKLKDMVKGVFNLSREAKLAEKAFGTMLWSAEAWSKMMKDLNKFSLRNGIDPQVVRENAKQLTAMGIAAEKTIPTMNALGNVSAALNVPLERLALNYGQVKTQGKLTGVDLRDFLRAGVPLIQELAKNLWVAEVQIKKMVSQGKIWFTEVEKAFQTMTSEGGKFFWMMSQRANVWNQAKIAITLIWESIGKSLLPVLDFLGTILKNIAEKLQVFVEKNKALSTTLFSLIAVGGLLLSAFTAIWAILPWLTAGMAALWVSFGAIARPITIVTGAILALSAGVDAYNKYQEELPKKNLASQNSFNELTKKLNENKKEQNNLNESFEKGTTSAKEYQEKMKRLKSQQELYTGAVKYAIKNQNDLNEAMEILDSFEINTEAEREQLLLLAQNIEIAANSYLKMAESKLAALSAENIVAKQKKEQHETRTGKRWLLWAGSVATFTDAAAQQLFLYNKDEFVRQHKEAEQAAKDVDQAQAAIESLKKTIQAIKDKPIESDLTGSDSWWNSSWKSWKSAEEKAKEQARKIKEAKLKELDDFIEKEAQRIQKSDKDKAWKMEQLAKLKESYDQRKIDIEGKTTEELLKMAEDYQKEQYKNYEELSKEHQKTIEDAGKDIEKYLDKIEEIGKKFEESQEKAKDSIAKIQGELTKLDTDKQLDIAKRWADAKKELEKEEKNLAKLQRDQKIWSTDDAEKISESQEKIRKLREEIAFVEENITAEVRAQAEEYQNMSKAQQMMVEYQKQRAKLVEKQEIFKAYTRAKDVKDSSAFKIERNDAGEVISASYKDENGNDKKIEDQENINEAIKLEAQQRAFQTQLKELEDHLKEKMDKYNDEAQKLAKLWSDNTQKYRDELKNRERDLANFVTTAEGLMARLKSSGYKGHSEGGFVGFADGGYTGMGGKYDVAGVVHKGEWVAPAMMVNALGGVFAELDSVRQGMQNVHTPNTIMNKNTTKTQNNTITVNSEFDLRGFLDWAGRKF